MPKQIGDIKVTGTIDNINFYEMEGEFYARKKTSLDKKRVTKDPAFANSRKASSNFGRASKISAAFYKRLPESQKLHGVQGKFTGLVNTALSEGKTEAEAILLLENYMSEAAGHEATGR